jgi:Spy/CpxP family protein refolding chaperone
MRNTLLGFIAMAALSGGLLIGQGPMSGGRFGAGNPQGDPQLMHERRLNFLTTYLELTAAQKEQAATIFETAAKTSQTLQPLLQQAQVNLHNAARMDPAQIDALAAEAGKLMGQMRAIHAKAFSVFYQILTPLQREKLDKMRDSGWGGGGGLGGGPHHR